MLARPRPALLKKNPTGYLGLASFLFRSFLSALLPKEVLKSVTSSVRAMTLLCALSQKQFSRHHCTHYISMHLLSQPEVGRLVRPRASPPCNECTCSGQLISVLSLAASSVLFWFFMYGVSQLIDFCGEVLNSCFLVLLQ